MKTIIRVSLVVYLLVGMVAGILALLGVSITEMIAVLLGVDRLGFQYPWLLLTLVAVVPLAAMSFTRHHRRVIGTMA